MTGIPAQKRYDSFSTLSMAPLEQRPFHSFEHRVPQEAVIERITEQAGLVELVELFKQSPNMTLDQCTNED